MSATPTCEWLTGIVRGVRRIQAWIRYVPIMPPSNLLCSNSLVAKLILLRLVFADTIEDEAKPTAVAAPNKPDAQTKACEPSSPNVTASTTASPESGPHEQLQRLRSVLQPVHCGRDRQHNRYWLLPAHCCLDASFLTDYAAGITAAVTALGPSEDAEEAAPVPKESSACIKKPSEPNFMEVMMLFVEISRTGGWMCYENAHVRITQT